jgi:hypothetical protein
MPHLVANIDASPPGEVQKNTGWSNGPRRPRFAVTKKGFVITVFRSEILANNAFLRHVISFDVGFGEAGRCWWPGVIDLCLPTHYYLSGTWEFEQMTNNLVT